MPSRTEKVAALAALRAQAADGDPDALLDFLRHERLQAELGTALRRYARGRPDEEARLLEAAALPGAYVATAQALAKLYTRRQATGQACEVLEPALEALRRQGTDEALSQALQQAYRILPEQRGWARELAGCYCRQGHPQSAALLLEGALKGQRDWRTLRLLGIAYRQTERTADAVAVTFEALQHTDPADAETRQQLAMVVLREQPAHPGALAAAGQRVRTSRINWLAECGASGGRDTDTRLANVELLARYGLTDDALAAAREFAVDEPDNRSVWDWIKRLCVTLGDAAGASEALLKAAESSVAFGDDQAAGDNLAELTALLSDIEPEPIMSIVASAMDDLSDARVFSPLQDAILQLDDYVEEIAPTNAAQMHYNLGVAYSEMELFEQAIREFEFALTTPALYAAAAGQLAGCFLSLQRDDDAYELLHRALRGGALSRREGTQVRFQVAEALRNRGDLQAAAWLYRDVQKADPNFPGIDGYTGKRQPTHGDAPSELRPLLAFLPARPHGRVVYL